MALKSLKLENEQYHNYFVQTTHKILSGLGMDYTIDEIDKMSVENGYALYFHNKKTKKWHLGIWAVGKWGVKEEIDGHIIGCGYGLESYEPLTICVFLVHDWTYDKFRPTYSNWHHEILKDGNVDIVIEDLNRCFKHPIDSYYLFVDEDSYNYQHKENNKYIAYLKGWYRNEFISFMKKKRQRWLGYIFTKIIMLISFFDKRIYHREQKFHKDRWNAEYEIAIVSKYGKTEWHDWKTWNDYDKIFRKFQKLCDYNLEVEFTYLDEDGNLPKNIWRGIYWEEEPEK